MTEDTAIYLTNNDPHKPESFEVTSTQLTAARVVGIRKNAPYGLHFYMQFYTS